ncbi:MAG: RNA polymerase sigma factor [Bryobacteraceae bacterium]|jgi:RNA polymerase sigma-70 factor (ECF subfamily)
MDEQFLSDEDLLQRMLSGDEEAFVALYLRRQGGVYRFALHMSGSATAAEDVTQEVFLALMRDGAKFDPRRGSLAAFLYGIARNHVLRSLDRPASRELEARAELASPDSDPLGLVTRNETIEWVRSAVLALPLHYREVVVLCELHEMDYAQAATAMGCAVGTVRSRLHRARGLLAQRLGAAARDPVVAGQNKPARCSI